MQKVCIWLYPVFGKHQNIYVSVRCCPYDKPSNCYLHNITFYCPLNGDNKMFVCCVLHLSDHSSAIPEKNHRSTDSDNEEFCDSMEHLAMDEVWCPSSKVYTTLINKSWIRHEFMVVCPVAFQFVVDYHFFSTSECLYQKFSHLDQELPRWSRMIFGLRATVPWVEERIKC